MRLALLQSAIAIRTADASETSHMEDEIDLRPYLLALLRRWQIIVGLALLLAVAAAVFVGLQPRVPQASADVLIASVSQQVNLDPRLANRDATLLTNVVYQRQALLGLATSNTLEARVANQLGMTSFEPGALLGRVAVSNDGDLIQITARGTSGAEAAKLAEAWGRSYEQLVAEVYSRDTAQSALIADQLKAARQRYGEAQSALEQFVGDPKQVAVEQQIQQMESLVGESRTSQQQLYSQYLTRTQDLDLILQDARSLRAQVGQGEAPDLSNSLALLALRTRVAGGGALPVLLSSGESAGVARSGTATIADLDRLIATLASERERLMRAAADLARSIAAGTALPVGVGADEIARYEARLAELRKIYEAQQSQQRLLTQSRDIAYTSLDVLQRKSDEQQIAQSTPQVSVRFVSSSITPAPSRAIQVVLYAAAGLILGLMAGVVVALILTFGRSGLPRAQAGAAPAQSAD
jgi:capsular polysaccharide biosynthesis protein